MVISVNPGKLYPVTDENLVIGDGDAEIQSNTKE